MDVQSQLGGSLRIGDQLVRIDRTCTKDAYARIATPGAEECGCAMCRNFITQRATVYPQSFLDLLRQLGIDAAKEGEVYYLGPAQGGKRLYGGWFFFCGELLEIGEKQTSSDGISYSVIGPGRMPSPNPRDAFGQNPLALDFSIEIPWVLPEYEDPEITIYRQSGVNHDR